MSSLIKTVSLEPFASADEEKGGLYPIDRT